MSYMLDAPSESTAYAYTSTTPSATAPEVTLNASASTVSFGGSVTFTGVVKDEDGNPMADQPVELWAVGYPYRHVHSKLSGVRTRADGSYTFKTP